MNITARKILGIFIFIGIILAVSFIDIPGDTKLISEIQNTGHTIIFGVLSVFIVKQYRVFVSSKSSNLLLQYFVAFCICIFAGIAIELIQLVTHRDADIYDVVRDIAGIVAFLGFYSVYDRQKISGAWSIWRMVITISLSLAIFILSLIPITQLSIKYYQRDRAFPVLVDFTSPWSSAFVFARDAELQLVDAPPDWIQAPGKSVAKLTFFPAHYPGLTFEEPQPDWTGYSFLSFNIFSADSEPLKLYIRVHDTRHNQAFDDRFNHQIIISPGNNPVRISLEDIRNAPKGRKMDMKNISGVIIFCSNLQSAESLYLSNLRLE